MSLSMKKRKTTPGTNLGELGTPLVKRLARDGVISFEKPEELDSYVLDTSRFNSEDGIPTAKLPKSRMQGGIAGKRRGVFVPGTVYGPDGNARRRYTAEDLPESIRKDYDCRDTARTTK